MSQNGDNEKGGDLDAEVASWVPTRHDELPDRAVDILLVIDSQGGVARSTEIRDAIGTKTTGSVRYYFKENLGDLEDRRTLVRQTQPDIEGSGTPPNVYQLTADGEEMVDYIRSHIIDSETGIQAQIDYLTVEVDALRERLDEFGMLEPSQVVGRATRAEERATRAEKRTKELDERLGDFAELVDDFVDRLDECESNQEEILTRLDDIEDSLDSLQGDGSDEQSEEQTGEQTGENRRSVSQRRSRRTPEDGTHVRGPSVFRDEDP